MGSDELYGLERAEANGPARTCPRDCKKITWKMLFRFLNQKIPIGPARSSFASIFHLTDLEYDDKHTLWENYAADAIVRGSHSKPGYVGWTGFRLSRFYWKMYLGFSRMPSKPAYLACSLLEEHGVRHYPFGSNGMVDLKCTSRNSRLDQPSIEVHSDIPLTLEVIWEGGTNSVNIEKDS